MYYIFALIPVIQLPFTVLNFRYERKYIFFSFLQFTHILFILACTYYFIVEHTLPNKILTMGVQAASNFCFYFSGYNLSKLEDDLKKFFIKIFINLNILAASIVSAFSIFHFATGGVYVARIPQNWYHEEIALITPSIYLVDMFVPKKTVFTYSWMLLICFGTLGNKKITSFLVLLVVGIYVLAPKIKKFCRGSVVSQMIVYICSFLTFSSMITLFVVLLGDDAPGGSTNVRSVAYLSRVIQFIRNPLAGTYFQDMTLKSISTFSDTNYFYTLFEFHSHSAVLDWLANGGIIGFTLLIIPFIAAITLPFRTKYIDNSDIQVKFNKVISCYISSYLVSSFFNPGFLSYSLTAIPMILMGYSLSSYKENRLPVNN